MQVGEGAIITWADGKREIVVVILRYVSGLLLVGPVNSNGAIVRSRIATCREADLTPIA